MGDEGQPAGSIATLLLDHLEASGRFCRDTVTGGLLHWGEISLRETSGMDSLHVTLSGNRLTAHIDRLSPLPHDHSGWMARYSPVRAIAHMLVHLRDALRRLVTGRAGEHRVELVCERRPAPSDEAAEREAAAWSSAGCGGGPQSSSPRQRSTTVSTYRRVSTMSGTPPASETRPGPAL